MLGRPPNFDGYGQQTSKARIFREDEAGSRDEEEADTFTKVATAVAFTRGGRRRPALKIINKNVFIGVAPVNIAF